MNILQDIDSKGNKYYVRTATDAEAIAGTSEDVLLTPANAVDAINALAMFSPNLDGGVSTSNYGAGPTIDGGDVNGS